MGGMLVVLVVGAAIVGGYLQGVYGVLIGGILGFFCAAIIDLRRRIDALEHGARSSAAGAQLQTEAEELPVQADAPAMDEPRKDDVRFDDGYTQPSAPAAVRQPSTEEQSVPTWQTDYAMPDRIPFDIEQKLKQYVKNFFTTGNVVVRVGLIVLFFGVAFLLKYAASRGLVPIELRLCGVAAGGVALLVLGWRLRMKKEAYALLLQGGGIGVLYLTVFGAVRLYELIPPALALVLMVAFVVLAGMLAIVQDARSLALFGACGGFLAPVLVSTGSGSHVMLFSYYALLNAGVLGTAWYKAWRELNLTGFIFTFSIGVLWGASCYRPAHFATVEPFLILFFLMYAAISILFALRQPPRLRGLVDGTLVFGLPLVAFGLQSALVRNFEYGLAMSACVLAAFYIVTATVLWKKQAEGLRLLTESFLALGVVFGSLAIPLALDGFWTAGSWALEGAGLVWIGLRQRRCLARSFGLLLQLGAGVALCVGMVAQSFSDMPVVNAFFLGCLMVSFAGFFSNFCYSIYREYLMAWEKPVHIFIMFWAVLWWFGGGMAEIGRHAVTGHGIFAALVFLSLSACALSWLNRKLAWEDCLFIPCGLLPALIPLAAVTFYRSAYEHPCARWGCAAWLLALGINYYLLKRHEQAWPKNLVGLYHVASLLLATALLTFEAAYWSNQALREAETWQFVTWCIVPGGVVAALYAWGRRLTWPIQRWSREYLCAGTGILAGFLVGWIVAGCLHKGSPAPLPYLPIINPLELAQIGAFLVIGKWYKENRAEAAPYRSVFFSVFAAGVFVWLNSVLARATHFLVKVPFDASRVWDAPVFQTSASILWTLSALGAMTFAARIQSRRVWFTGAGLAGMVVIKLFTVDLAGIGTVARIISFIGVGVLLLVVGYFSPLPPRRSMEDTQ